MQALKKGSYHIDAGQHYGTPKEIWGFRTRPTSQALHTHAKLALKANSGLLGLDQQIRDLKMVRTIYSAGAQHAIFQQYHLQHRIHRAYVSVHRDNDGRIYLIKNRVVPAAKLPKTAPFDLSKTTAIQTAKKALRGKKSGVSVTGSEAMWFPQNSKLVPAWRITLHVREPRQDWIIYVNAKTGKVISKYDNLSEYPKGVARVFDPSPVTRLGGHSELLAGKNRLLPVPDKAYRRVTLRDLDSSGYLQGKRVTTRPTKQKHAHRPDYNFIYKSDQNEFEQVMTYHHINEAIRYLEKLGYRGKRAIFRDQVKVNVNGTRQDNSWYSPDEKQLTFGTGAIDDAEDGETILHELGHAIQDAICPNFGQSHEAAAIGEGFGDYFAASFFASRKPENYQHCVMTWDGLLIGLQQHYNPPCLRYVANKKTYANFRAITNYEHENGEIWSATLWQIRTAVGQDVADRIILESHFQLDGFTTFTRAARAIIDADQNLFKGKHKQALQTVFRRRKLKLK
jgi:Zn-dependent metalloprotease